jgi:hypothetical protein
LEGNGERHEMLPSRRVLSPEMFSALLIGC